MSRVFKCIDNSNWGKGKLTLNQLYIALKIAEYAGVITSILVMADDGMSCSAGASRFIEVTGDKAKESIDLPKLDSEVKKIVSKVLGNETWDFFSGVAPGNCKCNIPRSQCDYHR